MRCKEGRARGEGRGVDVPMVRGSELLLALLEQLLEALDAIIARDELALRNGDLFLEARVLFDELALYDGELFEVTLQEHHLLLLRAVVGRPEHVVVLFARLVERNFKFDNLCFRSVHAGFSFTIFFFFFYWMEWVGATLGRQTYPLAPVLQIPH